MDVRDFYESELLRCAACVRDTHTAHSFSIPITEACVAGWLTGSLAVKSPPEFAETLGVSVQTSKTDAGWLAKIWVYPEETRVAEMCGEYVGMVRELM